MSARTRSPVPNEKRPATYADLLTVINTASAMIAALETRVETLETLWRERAGVATGDSEVSEDTAKYPTDIDSNATLGDPDE